MNSQKVKNYAKGVQPQSHREHRDQFLLFSQWTRWLWVKLF